MHAPKLHLVAPGRYGAPAVIAGDTAALTRLRDALDAAINTGAASVELYCSDGEPYELIIVAALDMSNVFTAYDGEINPVRSGRETVTMAQLYAQSVQNR